MAVQYWTGERQFPFMSQWKGCIFSAIHFSSVCHAVLIYWSSPLCGEWKGLGGSSEVHHAVAEKRCIDLSSYHYPSLFVYYLFDSPALFYEVKNWKGLSSAISGWVTLGTERGGACVCCFCTSVCICDCVYVFVWHCNYTLCVCACMHLYLLCISKKKCLRLCVFSPLHAQTHLTQQQMAVCHQSVDSSRIFPWKESQRRETRVQMVYSATSHPQGVMKEGLSYSRTASQCLPWNAYVQSGNSKSC